MPTYGMPGVSTDKRRSIITGAIAAVAVAVVAVAWVVVDTVRGDDSMQVVLQTELIGDGIGSGTDVRLDGVNVGSVSKIESAENGRQRITLQLNQSALFGVTDNLDIDYSPANLFGISEVELKRGQGGSPLRENAVIDLTGEYSGRVQDATMGALIRSLSQTSNSVLTPQFAETLTKVASDLRAFTPLIDAMIVTGRNLADTQKNAVSVILAQYVPALSTGAPVLSGTFQVLDDLNKVEILRTQRDLFDATANMVARDLLPTVTRLGFTAKGYLSGYADMLTPLLNITGQMVPAPQLSSAQLAEIIARLDKSFTDTPNGPMLNLALTLRGVPALAVPLLGTSSAFIQGGGR